MANQTSSPNHLHCERGMRRTSLAAIAVLLAACLACVAMPTRAFASPTHSTIDTFAVSSASTWNQVKGEYQALTYLDLVKASKPRIRALDSINARIALRKELGHEPTDAQVEARVYEKYMDQLNLAAAFARVKAGLNTKMPALIDRAQGRGVNADFLRKHKATILLGLVYLEHYYSFDLGGRAAVARIVDGPNGDRIFDVLGNIGRGGYELLRGYRTAEAYTRLVFLPMTG